MDVKAKRKAVTFNDKLRVAVKSERPSSLQDAIHKQNGRTSSSSVDEGGDDWDIESNGSLSSNEYGPLVKDNYNKYLRSSPKSKLQKATVVVLTVCLAAMIAIIIYLSFKPALRPVYLYQHAAVATDAGPCSDLARDILKNGGSAIDASIAAFLCLGLYVYQSIGIGGGHMLMYYHRDTQDVHMIEARGSAPLHATRDMFNNDPLLSMKGGLSIAVPGQIAGFWKAHQMFGRLPWSSLFEPTISLARKGFHVSTSLASAIKSHIDEVRNISALSQLLLREDGSPIEEGDIMRLPRLARTLERIALGGEDEFYRGQLAEDIVKDIQDNGGITTLRDLNRYVAKERKPLSTYVSNGLTVHTPPPPASGAVTSLILNIMDGFKFSANSFSSTNAKMQSLQRMVEAFKFAYAKGADLGDGDFVNVTQLVSDMTSHSFANMLRSKISDDITYNSAYYGLVHSAVEDHGTSHACIVDQYGNAVSITGTINLRFGSRVIGNRTGIIFNNVMGDFSQPYTPNVFGIPPSESNFIEPGKTPMSSMSPTIIVDDRGDVRLIIGSSGGSRIPSTVAQVIVKHLWGGIPITEAIRQKRFHHQWIPDQLLYETGFNQEVMTGLQIKGHNMTERSYMSVVQGISRDSNYVIEACSDKRKGGYPSGFLDRDKEI